MGIVVRQSVKSSTITVIGAALGVVTTILFIHFFQKADYGFVKNLDRVSTPAAMLSVLGFDQAILIFGPRYSKDNPDRYSLMTVSALFPLFIGLLVSLAFILFKNPILTLYNIKDAGMLNRFWLMFPALIMLKVCRIWLAGYLNSINKNALQNIDKEVIYRILTILLIICYSLGWINFYQFIWLYIIPWIILVLYLAVISVFWGDLKFSFKITLPKQKIIEIFRFSGYQMLSNFGSMVVLSMDVIMLGTSLSKNGFEAVAVYSVAVLGIAILRNPSRVIGSAVIPTFSRRYGKGDMKGLKRLYKKSSINLQILAFGLLAFVLLDIDFIQEIALKVNNGYGAIKELIIILIIGQIAIVATGFSKQMISLSKHYRYNFWLTLGLLIIVFILNYLLIPEYGIYGAAWATTVALCLYAALRGLFVWKKMGMQPFYKESFLALLAAGLAFAASFFVPSFAGHYVVLAVQNIVLGAGFMALVLWWKLSPEINEMADNIRKKGRLF